MVRKPAPVTQTELAILEVLWNKQPRNVREIVDELYPQRTRALCATVKSLLARLEAKGYVACDKSSFAHKFSARLSRSQYVGRQLETLAESHFGGSVAPVLLALVESIKLSRKDRDAIVRIVESLE